MALHIIKGNGAPTTAPAFIGQHYIDETNGEHYLANGVTSADDWQKVGSAGAPSASVANSGAAYTLDATVADLHDLTLDANCTLSLANPSAGVGVGRVALSLRQALGNAFTVTWPPSILWPGNITPVAPAAGELDRYTLETWDGGALWIAALVERGFVWMEGWLVGQLSYSGFSYSTGIQDGLPNGLDFSQDGTRMYISGYSTSTIYQHNLATAWDLSTAAYSGISLDATAQDGTPPSIAFSQDGTRMFMTGHDTDAVYQYNLTTAWDLSTAAYSGISLSIATETGAPRGVAFKPDGTVMFMVGEDNDAVYQYNLTTAWDLSTATYSGTSLSVATEASSPIGVAFNPQGTRMLISGWTNGAVFEYNLATAWDLSTAAYSGISLDTVSEDLKVAGLAWKDDGQSLFVVGNGVADVFEYSA